MLSCALVGEPVPVKYAEGLVHGFLVLRSSDGQTLAEGDLMQTVHANRVTSRLVFHFKDGSVHDDTVVFSQRRYFRLLSEHLVQKGPSFEQPIDLSINAAKNEITVKYTDKDGKQKTATEHSKLPPELANGLVLTLLKNVRTGTALKLSMFAVTPKPRLVKLNINAAGEETFLIGGSARKAVRYVVKVDIGGIAGAVAPLLGKQPPDTNVWILPGEAPAFVKSEGPLYVGGPVWRIELTSPVWKDSKPAGKDKPAD